MLYDIFYVSKQNIVESSWLDFRSRFPSSQKIENVKTFNDIKKKVFTKFFWVVWDDLVVSDDFNFEYRISKWDEAYIHIWLNGKTFDGINLFPKSANVSQKEFDHRFFMNKKEIDVVASNPKKFEIYNIKTYDDYLNAKEKSSSAMFWAVYDDIVVSKDFFFDYYVPVYDAFHRNITHVFKNGEFFDGISLFSKNKGITKKEFDHRFFIDKKEVDAIASTPKQYDKFIIETYDDYLSAKENATTDLFWIIPKEVEVLDTFKFDLYFSHHNIVERKLNHVFGHMFRGEETYNGISLVPTSITLSKKEVNFRFLIEKKKYDTVATKLKPYDIVFISYNEKTADENYENLKKQFPRAKRVHGVKGIHNAHIEAAKQTDTDMFWVVDGDAVIVDDFNFDHEVSVYEKDIVHVWLSKNPINDLVYGYGGVKLLPKQLTENMDVTSVDMTMSISKKFKVVKKVSNLTSFNTDPFSTWKSAFRECVKLASRPVDSGYQEETEDRLITWCNVGVNKPYGEYSIAGARAGKQYGLENIADVEQLVKINNFEWLQDQFNKLQTLTEK
jgi:hypothetical protein